MRMLTLQAMAVLAVCSLELRPVAADATTAPASRPHAKITISKETTYVTGPLNADGIIDYVRAINDHYGKGVTRDNNAAIDLIRILGPNIFNEDARKGILVALGLPADLPDPNVSLALPESSRHWWASIPTSDIRKPPADAREWLASKETILNALAVATKKSRFFVPTARMSDPPGFLNPTLGLNRHLGGAVNALLVRATIQAADADAAAENLLAANRMARLMSQQPFLTHLLLAEGLESFVSGTVGSLVKAGAMTPQLAKRLLDEMSRLPPRNEQNQLLGERLFALDSTLLIARVGLDKATQELSMGEKDDPVPEMQLDMDELLRATNVAHDRIASCLSKTRFDEQLVAAQRLASSSTPLMAEIDKEAPGFFEPRKKLRLLAKKGAALTPKERSAAVAGMTSLSQTMAAIIPVLARTRVVQRRNQIALALVVYRAQHKRYPDRLAQLAPAIMPALPDDPFSDKPFVYHKTDRGYLLYSVGKNMRDDGGDCLHDIVFEVDR